MIAAGYPGQMHRFLDMNPGRRSRMAKHLAFEDYRPPEMAEIFRVMANQAEYALTHGTDPALLATLEGMWANKADDFANARSVRHLFEQAISIQATRFYGVADPTAQDL